LESECSNKISTKFLTFLEQLLNQIATSPKQFPVIYRPLKIRKGVITKHNNLYYINRKSFIEVLRIYDNRQDPKKLTIKNLA